MPSPLFKCNWGGVAAIYRSDLSIKNVNKLEGPDLQILDCGPFIVFNAYVLPENSPWGAWTTIHPLQLLSESLTTASLQDKPCVALMDGNSRIASQSALPSHPGRTSNDTHTNARGKALLNLAGDCKMIILNGIASLPGSGAWTLFQGKTATERVSVIDYAWCSQLSLSAVKSLTISGWAPDMSDHASVSLELHFPKVQVPPIPRPPPRLTTADARPISYLDHRIEQILSTAVSADDTSAQLYGLASIPPTRMKPIYCDGSCLNNGRTQAKAGVGVFFGRNSHWNISICVTGC